MNALPVKASVTFWHLSVSAGFGAEKIDEA